MVAKRAGIAAELQSTEATFRVKLELVVNEYQTPLMNAAHNEADAIITVNEVRAIFSSIEVILGLSKEVDEELRVAVGAWNPMTTQIGAIFLRFTNFFRWYQTYCANYTQVHGLLEQLKASNPRFKDFIKKTENGPKCKGEDLETSLIRVVQRIPQYNMLLSDLLKNTWPDHVDYENIGQAVAQMNETGKVVNEQIRESENMSKVLTTGEALEGFQGLAVPHRRHVFDASVMEVNSTVSPPTETDKHIFIFNDLLIFAAPHSNAANPKVKFKCEKYAYLINNKGMPNVRLEVIEGHPTFKLRIKDEAIELRTKRPIDRTNLNKAILEAFERIRKAKRTESRAAVYQTLRLRTSSMSIGSGLGLLGDLSESDEWVKPTKKKDDHSESKSLTSKLLQDCPELKEKFETYHEEAVWATALEIYDRVVKMKLSPHSLVLTSHRIIIVDNKNKVVLDAHIMDLRGLASSNYSEIKIQFQGELTLSGLSQQADEIITQVRKLYQKNFPGRSNLLLNIDKDRLVPLEQPELISGGFSTAYTAVCSYFGTAIRQDVIWDADHVLSKDVQELDFRQFQQPLLLEDFRAILKALVFNSYFKGVILDGFSHSKDYLPFLIDLLQQSIVIEKFCLRNVAITKEQWVTLTAALADSRTPLKHIDFTNTDIPEKGYAGLIDALKGRKIESLILDKNPESKKALSELLALPSLAGTLTSLSLADSALSEGALAALAQFLKSPNALKTLNLSGAKFGKPTLSSILPSLTRGCSWNLVEIDLSRVPLDARTIPDIRTFLESSTMLKKINLSSAELPFGEFVQLLHTIEVNTFLSEVTVEAANNNFGASFANALRDVIAESCHHIVKLDISDNDFGDDGMLGILEAIVSENHSIEELICNRNFKLGSGKNGARVRSAIATALKTIARSANSTLRVLHIAGLGSSKSTQLREDLIPFLTMLARNSSIQEINISGHKIGYNGIVALAKCVQINSTLRTLHWDENALTLLGLKRFAMAVNISCDLVVAPMPMLDIGDLLKDSTQGDPNEIIKVVSEVQSAIGNSQLQIQDKLASEVLSLQEQLSDLKAELAKIKAGDVKEEKEGGGGGSRERKTSTDETRSKLPTFSGGEFTRRLDDIRGAETDGPIAIGSRSPKGSDAAEGDKKVDDSVKRKSSEEGRLSEGVTTSGTLLAAKPRSGKTSSRSSATSTKDREQRSKHGSKRSAKVSSGATPQSARPPMSDTKEGAASTHLVLASQEHVVSELGLSPRKTTGSDKGVNAVSPRISAGQGRSGSSSSGWNAALPAKLSSLRTSNDVNGLTAPETRAVPPSLSERSPSSPALTVHSLKSSERDKSEPVVDSASLRAPSSGTLSLNISNALNVLQSLDDVESDDGSSQDTSDDISQESGDSNVSD